MVVGYARVSTPKQKLDRQISNLRSVYPDIVIVAEVYTGSTDNRPKWTKLMGSKVGRQKGQKIVTRKQLRAKRIIRKYYTLFGGYLSATETYTLAKITKSTFYRYLEQIYEEDKSKGIEWDRDFIPEEDKNVALETITQKIMAHKQHKEKET